MEKLYRWGKKSTKNIQRNKQIELIFFFKVELTNIKWTWTQFVIKNYFYFLCMI